ncbi:MAG TPA: 2-phosphosulfolactate phosphatase, partial [Gemmataceae bacterium]|nr:2-phosphosulfolactate phosphatase [Gemmataceae bacterium]
RLQHGGGPMPDSVTPQGVEHSSDRDVHVHLLPGLAPPGRLSGGVAVVIDVLRATTTIIYALAAGCIDVFPCAEVDEARKLADGMRAGRVVLGGERGGLAPPGFDLGNSPREYTPCVCKNTSLVLTTTNGTRALLRAAEAERVLVAGFVNYSAVCEQLKAEARPIHIVCAGTEDEITLEDTLLAGALVDFLCEEGEVRLNDSARLAWDCFETHGRVLEGALEVSRGGENLRRLGYDDDIGAAARVDLFALVPELRRDPLRIEVGAAGIVKSHWLK